MTLVLVVAVLAGYLAGGRIGNLANLHLRGLVLLLAAVCAPFAAGWLGGPGAATTGTALALLLVAGFLGLNVRERRLRTALVLLAVGWSLNSVAVLANGGMPSPPEVLAGPDPRSTP